LYCHLKGTKFKLRFAESTSKTALRLELYYFTYKVMNTKQQRGMPVMRRAISEALVVVIRDVFLHYVEGLQQQVEGLRAICLSLSR
jgi:hypothetical protein